MEAGTSADQHAHDANTEGLEHIRSALRATLDPRVSNDVRKHAFQHLESVKTLPDAPLNGFRLAEDPGQDEAIRYYGLQLLEFAIRYRWYDYSTDEMAQLQTWVTSLAGNLRPNFPISFRNKLGQLWVEVAKRSWGDSWMNMDQQLAALWETSLEEKGMCNKVLVLYILEQLSEDVINGEDAVAGLRLEVLGNALNEIMLPPGMFVQLAETRGERREIRFGTDGWLSRVCKFFAQSVQHAVGTRDVQAIQALNAAAMKALNALKPAMSWVSLRAADEVGCVECLFVVFQSENLGLQIGAVEVLYILLNRHWASQSQDTWVRLCRAALRSDRVALLRRTFEANATLPGGDDESYTMQKKISELLSVLADALSRDAQVVNETVDLQAFFALSLLALESESLAVSIPILHSWTRLMAVQEENILDNVLTAMPTLLNVCSERLMRYEALPDDFSNKVVEFLNEDFDTVPERHAFLGNYRRYCNTIIVSIARYKPIEALAYVLGRMHSHLESGPYTIAKGLNPADYSKNALSVLQFDAQYNVVAGTIKGFSAWSKDVEVLPDDGTLHVKAGRDHSEAMSTLQQWCSGVTSIPVDDPLVASQVMQAIVLVLRAIPSPPPDFFLTMVQHILMMSLTDSPAHANFSESCKAFDAMRVIELQKLALGFADYLLKVYQDLETQVEKLVTQSRGEQRSIWGYRAFLFMIIHRAHDIPHEARLSRLQQMLQPIHDAWSSPALHAMGDNLQTFCAALGLGDLPNFYATHGFDRTSDWSSRLLDESGQVTQNDIKDKGDQVPLRMVKSMLSATTEKLKSGTEETEVACALWAGIIPVVLPRLLRVLRHAQAFHNMANWAHLSPPMQSVMKRTLQDRFWQSGISSESKDEFYARISGTKTSYEGFASTVRGVMRLLREQGYHVLYLMTKFEEQFYGLADLADPLAEALFADAACLNANHLHPIINLTTGLVQRCPAHHRAQFLPPVLRSLFVTLDRKISADWESIRETAEQNRNEDDELSDEMRTESVLRQLTYSMVTFVPFLLEYDRFHLNGDVDAQQPSIAQLVLSNPSILEPLILFCTHALSMRDTRCCSTICRVFRVVIPIFAASQPDKALGAISTEAASQVREFICTEVLKACITSLHEPYFVDMQRDLAALIAQIIRLYAAVTPTPCNVLLSLPNMSESRVSKSIDKICKAPNERAQRAQVLELLEGVRGKSIYEAGKIDHGHFNGTFTGKKVPRNGVQQRYMEVEPHLAREGDDSNLEGVEGLFGEA